MYTYNINSSVGCPANPVTAPVVTLTGDGDMELDIPVAAAASAVQKAFAVKVSTIQVSMLLFTAATGPGATKTMTVKTNSSGSPQETITLTSGVINLYYVGGPTAVQFGGDVTTIYITDTTSNAVGGTLSIRCLTNQ